MAWKKEAITDGEIDALSRAALAACHDDTRYPLWRSSSARAGGHCYVIARWLVHRLGGHVGKHQGHYVWLSPDDRYYIDLTAAHGDGEHPVYARTASHERVEFVDNDRTARFIKRADRIFDSLDTLLRLSLDYAGDAYPAQEPQAADDSERFNDSGTDSSQYWHDEPDPTTPEGVYQFIYANGQLEVSPNHAHHELADHVGIEPSTHKGPFAAGHLVVTNGMATWEVQSNMNLHAFLRPLKEATKSYGWRWGGMTDASGQPIVDSLGPAKSATTYNYVYSDGHLLVGRTSAADLVSRSDRDLGQEAVSGHIDVLGSRAMVSTVHVDALPSLFEFADDNGLTLYAGNDNVIKTIPDLQQHNLGDPNPQGVDNPVEPPTEEGRLPTGLYRCPGCTQLFPNWHEYSRHRPECAEWADPDHMDNGDRGLPEGRKDDTFGDSAHFTEMRQEPGITTGKVMVLVARTWKEAARVDGFFKYAKPFAYDNDDYSFYVAYRNGDPIGYAAVKPDGYLHMLHSSVENAGAAKAIFHKLTRHFDTLYTGAMNDKSVRLLRHYGWVQADQAMWKWSKDKAPRDLLEASVPFIYDVQEDKIHMGHPGARTSDIPGRFTPGGIVEGMYEPGGKVVIRSLTSVPYTVRHLIELWYYSQPTLEVKSVHLQDDAGKDTRLATAQIAAEVRTLTSIDPAAFTAATALKAAGGEVWVVGGAVRDVVLDKDPKDFDLMVAGLPGEQVNKVLKALPGKAVHEGKSFAVWHYRHKGTEIQVALPRQEHSTGPGHKDFEVTASHKLKPKYDLARRDLTANAMAVNLFRNEFLDPHNGIGDIRAGVLRTVSPESFADDPLRTVRAIVAHARHGLIPDQETRRQMMANADGLRHLSAERIQQELDKLMEAADPAAGIRLAHETGVLAHILPEVDAAFGYDQNNRHHELHLGDHLLSVLERMATQTTDKDLRLAALLHDIGKPASEWKDEDGRSHFYAKHLEDGTVLGGDHETVGAELARERLNALRYPKERVARITALIASHMWPAFTTQRGARRFLSRVSSHADDLLRLRWADQGGKTVYPSDPSLDLLTQRKLIDRVREAGEATNQSQLVITGTDLIKAGIEPGPRMGKILAHLTERVLDEPALNTPDVLLAMARASANLPGDEREVPQVPQTGQAQEGLAQPVRQGESPKLAQGDEEAEVEFPSLQEAQEIHDQAVIDHGQPYAALSDPAKLESAMGRATNHYYYGQGTPGERVADAAGALAHGIGMAQAFVDGNKKTAYHTTRYFLHNNGYGHLSPVDHDDEEFAAHLMGHGEGTHSLEDTQQLFRSRLGPEESSV